MIVRDGIVLLEFADLVNEACMDREAFYSAVRRNTIIVVSKGGNGRQMLVDWSSLAERYKDMVRAHLGGDPAELAKLKTIERFLEVVPADEQYLAEFKASNGHGLTKEKRIGLQRASRVLALLARMDDMRRAQRPEAVAAHYGMPMLAMKQAILGYIKLERLPLPNSFARLEARKRAYLEARNAGRPGASSLIHGGYGNQCAGKLADDVQNQVLLMLASQHQNHTAARLATDYNILAIQEGWSTITPNTVLNWKKKGVNGRSVTYYAKGKSAYADQYHIVNHRLRPSAPTLMWVHDGDVYELYYQREERGKVVSWLRKVVVVVLDPHSHYPVGYAIGESDTIELTKAAIKAAVEHMRILTGEYMLPHQVQSDKLGRGELKRWYQAMDVAYTPAASGLARAKVIESYFAKHHRSYLVDYPNFGGQNIDSKKRNQPNPDALDRLAAVFPDEAGVVAQIHEAFARERAAKVAEFKAGLANLATERRRVINRATFLDLFGTAHPYTNELTNRGICPTIGGIERHYNLLDVSFQELNGTQFQVVYDPADLSNVLVSAFDGQKRFVVPETMLVPMALADHTPQTRAHLAAVEAFKKELGQAAIDKPLNGAVAAMRVAERIIESAQLRIAKESKGRSRKVELPADEEAVVRSYAKVNGSHKAALAQVNAMPVNKYDELSVEEIRRRALDQL